jgi:hypothetical protein
MVLGIVSSAASTAPPFKVTLNLQSHAERVLCQGEKHAMGFASTLLEPVQWSLH